MDYWVSEVAFLAELHPHTWRSAAAWLRETHLWRAVTTLLSHNDAATVRPGAQLHFASGLLASVSIYHFVVKPCGCPFPDKIRLLEKKSVSLCESKTLFYFLDKKVTTIHSMFVDSSIKILGLDFYFINVFTKRRKHINNQQVSRKDSGDACTM